MSTGVGLTRCNIRYQPHNLGPSGWTEHRRISRTQWQSAESICRNPCAREVACRWGKGGGLEELKAGEPAYLDGQIVKRGGMNGQARMRAAAAKLGSSRPVLSLFFLSFPSSLLLFSSRGHISPATQESGHVALCGTLIISRLAFPRLVGGRS
ncbi:hypothetical protein VTK73DRAFT_7973 [Phialemonium thermophilum]|uniref:Uncharacterized protein n=1 Tax=Phialemonium thermophilum TaxID=223376 RepID=A0ABR3WBH8_9PEZI